MGDTMDNVIKLLETYRKNQQYIMLLQFEIRRYEEMAGGVESASSHEMRRKLDDLIQQRERLEVYIGTLGENDAKILRMTYMDGRSNGEIARELRCSLRTINSHRKRAIDELCELYAFADSLTQE